MKTNKPNHIISWGIAALVFLLPLFFLPLTTDFYTWNKNFLLILGVLGLLGLWGARGVLARKTVFVHTPLDLPVLGLAVAVLASSLLASPNKVESFLLPGGAGTILALTILFFLITNLGNLGNLGYLSTSLTASAVVLSVIAIWQFFGVGEVIAPVEWLKSRIWTPAGGLLPLATFLGVVLLGNLVAVRRLNLGNLGNPSTSPAERDGAGRSLGNLGKAVASLLLFLGLGVTTYQLVTTNRPLFLPHSTAWVVALESFKNNPLFGVGPGQFLSAFSRYKPLAYTQTNLWALRFGNSSNWYFQLLTEVGILGLGAFLWIGVKALRSLREPRGNQGKAGSLSSCPAVLLIFLSLALLPANFLLLLVFFVLLAQHAVCSPETQRLKINLVALKEGLVSVQKTELEKYMGEMRDMGDIREEGLPAQAGKIEILPWLVFIPIVILVLGSFYLLSGIYAAEMDYKKALDAAIANRGKDTYDLHIAAISKNPYFDYYRTSYSQINLALANNIAQNPDLTDQDRATITQLVQQAIREGKAAIALNPVKVTNWENLASLYRTLINFAQDAEQWTVATYTQAINLDPFNPGLRLDLGGVFYGLKNYEQAQRQFEIAVNLKPDLANAHYNLAAALKEKGELELAKQQLEVTLALVEVGSADYERVKNELTTLKQGLVAKEATPSAGLEEIAPPETPSAGIEPPLELGKEAGPEITPSPQQTETTPTP